VESQVIFHDRFASPEEMAEFIGAADIYITPYRYEEQVVSGTLAYALGAGKAIISTPYWHAIELLDDRRGALVPFQNPGAIAQKTIELLDTPRAPPCHAQARLSVRARYGLEKSRARLHGEFCPGSQRPHGYSPRPVLGSRYPENAQSAAPIKTHSRERADR
jgi:glycosyltransferase involved in cell wall biosynthesis